MTKNKFSSFIKAANTANIPLRQQVAESLFAAIISPM